MISLTAATFVACGDDDENTTKTTTYTYAVTIGNQNTGSDLDAYFEPSQAEEAVEKAIAGVTKGAAVSKIMDNEVKAACDAAIAKFKKDNQLKALYFEVIVYRQTWNGTVDPQAQTTIVTYKLGTTADASGLVYYNVLGDPDNSWAQAMKDSKAEWQTNPQDSIIFNRCRSIGLALSTGLKEALKKAGLGIEDDMLKQPNDQLAIQVADDFYEEHKNDSMIFDRTIVLQSVSISNGEEKENNLKSYTFKANISRQK